MNFWQRITEDKNHRISLFILTFLTTVLFIGGTIVAVFFAANNAGRITILVWILACLLLGAVIGFLFGIPKTLQGTRTWNKRKEKAIQKSEVEENNEEGKTNSPSYELLVNTNLTEVSDWLTKIIVGLSLVNLNRISSFLTMRAAVLAQALSNSSNNSLAIAFAYGLIVAFTIFGFLFGYNSTRMILSPNYSRSDQGCDVKTQED
jgi:hypothetical protein